VAQSISLGSTSFPQGTQQFLIDTLPANSAGFELTLGVGPTWESAVGRLFDLKIDISIDGSIFQPWISVSIDGGIVRNKAGVQQSTWTLRGSWPGENDGSGGRRVLRGAILRVTLIVAQAFTATSVNIRTV
jgi:hypothetical protein